MSRLLTWTGELLEGIGLKPIDPYGFRLGVHEPTLANSGVPSGTSLTPYSADIATAQTISVTADGTVFEDVDFGNIRMDVRAYNVVFRRCRWTVTQNRTSTPMVRTDQAPYSANCRMEQCTIENRDQHGYNYNAVQGHDVTLYRCKILGTTDGVRPNLGGNVRILGCFIGFLGWWGTESGKPALNSGDQTHSDCIQTTYGGVEVVGNSLWAYPSTTVGTGTPGNGTDAGNPDGWYTQAQSVARRAALMGTKWTTASQSADGVSHEVGGIITPMMCNLASGPSALDLVVTDNWFAGGQVQVNALATNLTTSLGAFRRNRHYNDSANKAAGKSMVYRLAVGLGATIPLTGPDINVYMDGSGVALIVQ